MKYTTTSRPAAPTKLTRFVRVHRTPHRRPTRGSNTYGPYQYPEKLIPLFVTNLIDDTPLPVYGDGHQLRDRLHVDDHARGILHVLEHGVLGEIHNIAGGNSREKIDITKKLIEASGRSWDTHVKHVSDRTGHDRRYSLDTSKAARLGWKPAVDFDRGLFETVAWYKANERGSARSSPVNSSTITRPSTPRDRTHEGHHLSRRFGFASVPLNKVTNKHLLPIYDKPMIYYPLEILCKAGIDGIMIVTGGNSAGDFLRLLGNGREFGLHDIHYTYSALVKLLRYSWRRVLGACRPQASPVGS
jgi:hypothetical protein